MGRKLFERGHKRPHLSPAPQVEGRISIGHNAQDGNVVIALGQPPIWVGGFKPDVARQLAAMIVKEAETLEALQQQTQPKE